MLIKFQDKFLLSSRKNVGSLRTLLSAATAKAGGKRALLEIIE